MILQSKPRLEEKIVQLLMLQPNQSAAQLLEAVNGVGKDYSVQAVYKELRKLHHFGVVAKHRTHYSLRIPWVLDVVALIDQMKQRYLDATTFDAILPGLNHRKSWHFTNLNTLNNFWSQVLLVAVNKAHDKRIVGYSPHPWYHLLQTEQEDQYIQSLRHAGARLYLIMGNATFLDKWAEKFWPKDVVEYSYAESPYHKERGWYFDLVDDYLVGLKIDKETSAEIDRLYHETPNWEALDLAKVIHLSQKRVRAVLSVEHNPRKAEITRKRFIKFFGI